MLLFLFTVHQQSCGKVMFSVVSVTLAMWLLPKMHWPHCKTPPVQGPTPLAVTSGGQDWKPVQTCSLEDLPHCTGCAHHHPQLVLISGGYLLKHIWLANMQYASYWKTSLFRLCSFVQTEKLVIGQQTAVFFSHHFCLNEVISAWKCLEKYLVKN